MACAIEILPCNVNVMDCSSLSSSSVSDKSRTAPLGRAIVVSKFMVLLEKNVCEGAL